MHKEDFFRIQKLTEHTTRITGITGEQMYLVEGSERAALVDAGAGIGNLKELVGRLTKKPVMVLLTHGHVDHAGGAALFDSVYMDPADRELYEQHSAKEVLLGFAENNLGERFQELDEQDFVFEKVERFHDLHAGDVVELGGITLEMYSGKGHTQGSLVMLIREERTLILGDACNLFTFLFDEEASGVAEYMQMLEKLRKDTEGKYDRVYLSHGPDNIPADLMERTVTVCRDILEGKSDDIPYEFLGKHAYVAKAVDFSTMERTDGGFGNVVYKKSESFYDD